MKDSDLQKIGVMICAIIWLIAPKLPFAALCLAMFIWPAVLAFDSLDNRGEL